LLAGVIEEPEGSGLALRVRSESVLIGFRILLPAGLTANARLVIQPSLLDGHIFLGLRQVYLGLLPVPPGWMVSLQGEIEAGGWLHARGTPGYVLPGQVRHQGVLLEVIDIWCADGLIEIVLREAVFAGDR
jgi:hypothetical protein